MKRSLILLLLAIAAMPSFLACAKKREPSAVTGTVTYRERIALPINAAARVVLLDVSVQDVAATTVAETIVASEGGQVPLSFTLEYDPAAIDTSRTYAVRAEIHADGELMWVSTMHTPVITRGNPTHVDLMLFRAAGTAADVPDGATEMVGLYAYMADAGQFTLCSSGVRMPVALEADNAALERAYTGTSHEPGAPVIVSVLGRIEKRDPMEGPNAVDHVIVDRFLRLWPEETCEKSGVETPLSNTYWKLVELNGAPVKPQDGTREAHMILNLDGKSVAGSGGCNRFTGSYESEGTSLRFGPAAATMMACPDMQTESEFFKALESVTGYDILGETLVLLTDSGAIARLRAVYF